MDSNKKSTQREYFKPSRFEIELSCNNDVIGKKMFKINWFNEGSFNSLDFKEVMDEIVFEVQKDLESKTRIMTWYMFNEEDTESEFYQKIEEPWSKTMKLAVKDNGITKFERIWDGTDYYPMMLETYDFSNKTFQLRNGVKLLLAIVDETMLMQDGMAQYRAKKDREDIGLNAIRKICKVCSPENITFDEKGKVIRSGMYSDDSCYTKTLSFKDKANKQKPFKYFLNKKEHMRNIEKGWAEATKEKTNKYFGKETNWLFVK